MRHSHPCPRCYERVPCSDVCSTDPNDDSLGAFSVCDRCKSGGQRPGPTQSYQNLKSLVAAQESEIRALREAVSQLRTLVSVCRTFVEGKAVAPDPTVLLVVDGTLLTTKKYEI